MEIKYAISVFVVLPLFIMLASSWIAQYHISKSNRKLIEAQQETIQKLLNREPVTYQETGQKQPKIIEEVYSAWGGVTVDREIEDSRE